MDTLDGRLKRVNDVFTDLLDNTLFKIGGKSKLSYKESISKHIEKENLMEEWLGDTPAYTEVHGISAL